LPRHIDHAATVTARMPTPEECAAGFTPDAPVLVVEGGGLDDKVFSSLTALTFDDPHGQPGPDAVRAAVLYVLGIIGQDLNLMNARVDELADAIRRSPCAVGHLADAIREEQSAMFHCADPSMCEHTGQPSRA
jgi:hypothetical protein